MRNPGRPAFPDFFLASRKLVMRLPDLYRRGKFNLAKNTRKGRPEKYPFPGFLSHTYVVIHFTLLYIIVKSNFVIILNWFDF